MLEREQADQVQTELLRRVAARDRQAMTAFYQSTAGPLFSLALRILGDPPETEKTIQDAFVQIWDKAGSFDPRLGSPFHWALGITRHRSIDRLRSRQRRTRLMEEFQNSTASEPLAASPADQGVVDADQVAAIRSALNQLPREQREAIEMAFFGGKTHFEIAEAFQQPLGTIKARIRRGMLKLRDSLQTYA